VVIISCLSIVPYVQAFRIAVMQSTTVLTNYYNDQLKQDIEREERVAAGTLTRKQAEREEEAWQEVCSMNFDKYCCDAVNSRFSCETVAEI
jgi:hypothetical protein